MRLHLSYPHLHPRRGIAALRGWVRQTETGVILLAAVVGAISGLLAVAIGGIARVMHVLFYGPGAEHGLSSLQGASPWVLLLLPAVGGLVLGGLNRLLARIRPRAPVDPIEANALHGGRLSMNDGLVVVAQNLVSNGFGASVGLEAGYTQIAGGAASRLGRIFGLRRGGPARAGGLRCRRRHRRRLRRPADRRLLCVRAGDRHLLHRHPGTRGHQRGGGAGRLPRHPGRQPMCWPWATPMARTCRATQWPWCLGWSAAWPASR
jgi:hypothetical protein